MKRLVYGLVTWLIAIWVIMATPGPAGAVAEILGLDDFTDAAAQVKCSSRVASYRLTPTKHYYSFTGKCTLDGKDHSYSVEAVYDNVTGASSETITVGSRSGKAHYNKVSEDPWLFHKFKPASYQVSGNLFICNGAPCLKIGSSPYSQTLLPQSALTKIHTRLYGRKSPPAIVLPTANMKYGNSNVRLVFILFYDQILAPYSWVGWGHIQVLKSGKWITYTHPGFKVEAILDKKYVRLVSNTTLPHGSYRIMAQGRHPDHKKAGEREFWITPTSGWVNFSVDAMPTKLSQAPGPAVVIPRIRVIKPNGGETVPKDSSYLIKWNAAGVTGKVRVVLRKGGTYLMRLTPTDGVDARNPNSILGSFSWTVSGNQIVYGDDDYTIAVVSIDDPSIKDESNGTFTIGVSSAPYKSPMKKSGARRAVTHTAKKKKVASPPAQVTPAIKNLLAGKALKSPAKITPQLELGPKGKLKRFVVQRKGKAGKWVLHKKTQKKKFTIRRAGKYRYRAVLKSGDKTAWDSFKVTGQ